MNNQRIGQTLGVWRLDELIGSGGMGDVYAATRIDGVVTGRAAVKVLRELSQSGSSDEATTLRQLDHTNIARYLDSGMTQDGLRYVAMEYVRGVPITEHSDQAGLSMFGRLELFLKACEAIEYSHQHLIVHLDLKPGNILVNRDRQVKVIDFGVARRVEGSASRRPAEAFSGPYASPEQIQPGSRLGIWSDVYSLGTVLYELLSGHEPFDPLLSSAELARQILEDSPRPPSAAIAQSKLKRSADGKHFRLEPEKIARMRGGCRLAEARRLIGKDLDRICLFALRKDPGRRYGSVDGLRSDLESVLAGRKPRIAKSGDPMYSALRAARRKPLEIMAAIAVVSAVLGGAWLLTALPGRAQAVLESRRQVQQIRLATLEQIRGRFRPGLTGDPRLRATLDSVDAVLRNADPPPQARAWWDKIRDYLFLLLRKGQTTETMPKE